MLLVFEREDAQSDAWLWAARKLATRSASESTPASNGIVDGSTGATHARHLLVRSLHPETVHAKMAELDANVIVIDRRWHNRSHEADALCR